MPFSGKEQCKNLINFSPVCTLKPFYPDTFVFPVTKLNKFQSRMFARGETRNIFASRGMQSLISRAPEHEPCFTTQTKPPNTRAFYLGSSASPHLPLALPCCTCCACQNKTQHVSSEEGSRSETSSVVLTCRDLSCWHLPQP